MLFSVYIIISNSDKKNLTYVGYTNNLKKRLLLHNTSKGAKFTKGKIWKLIYSKRYSTKSIAMKEYLNLAGIENKNFAGHSLRSGFATVAAESGADERSIMAMTGHKTTQMVRRYIREANIFKNNALSKIKL